jgi:N-acetylneuraminic acid mutarotase
MRAPLLLQLVAVLAGCNASDNACDGKPGVCIGVVVSGRASNLDQLAFTIGTQTMRSPAAAEPTPLELPVKVAVFPPVGVVGDITLKLDGLAAGVVVAHDEKPVSVPASGSVLVRMTLDGAGAPADLAPGDGGCVPVSCGATTVGMMDNGCGQMVDCGPPTIVALSPAVATSGDTIVINGRFGNPTAATVNFPGGVSGSASMVGPSRAIATVPAGATAGGLTLTVGGVTTNALSFRRTSFAIGLQTFRPAYDQGAYARVMPTLLAPRAGHTLATVNGFVFAIGGTGGAGPLDSIERVLINADSTLSGFVASSQKLTTPRAGHTSVVLGNRIYVIGGNGPLDTIEMTTVDATGNLTGFADPGVKLGIPRAGATAAIVGNYVYVIGGVGQASIERAPIQPDGTLGPFVDAGVSLLQARSAATCHVIGSNLYVLGGIGAGGVTNTIELAAIGPDGTLGMFADAGVSLVGARGRHVSELLGSRLYVMGGRGMSGQPVAVEQASVSGTLGGFTVVPNVTMATAREDLASVVVGNQLHLVGGSTNAPVSTVDFAQINGSGVIGSFAASGSTLTRTRVEHTMAVIGNNLYVFSGRANSVPPAEQTIDRATIRPDGTLSNFTDTMKMLSKNREKAAIIVSGGYVNILGGSLSVGGDDDYERAPINQTDGTLGDFQPVGGSIGGGRKQLAVMTVGRSGFLIGGAQATTTSTLVRTDPNALLSFEAGSALNPGKYNARSLTAGSSVYVLGGDDVGIQVATFDPTSGKLSPFGPSVSANTVRGQPSVIVIGNKAYIFGGAGISTTENSYESAPIDAAGNLGTFTQVNGSLVGTAGIGDHTNIVIGNYLYLVGGFVGTTRSAQVYVAPLQ